MVYSPYMNAFRQTPEEAGGFPPKEKPEGKADNFFSNEQLASLKAKGYSDKKIEALKKNMQNAPSMPTSK